ncbi:hypothetical protein [Paenibacillus sp. TAF43_2]
MLTLQNEKKLYMLIAYFLSVTQYIQEQSGYVRENEQGSHEFIPINSF